MSSRYRATPRLLVVVFHFNGLPVLDELAVSDFKWAVGAGLRFRVSQQQAINLRLDIGAGEEGSHFYFNIFEAF
jgi:hypothetical protein